MRTKNLAKKCKRKARLWRAWSLFTFVIFNLGLAAISGFNIDREIVVIGTVMGFTLAVSAGLLHISLSYQPALRKKSEINEARFKNYFESCLRHIKRLDHERAKYIYNNGLRFYSRGSFNDRQMFLRGAISHLSGKINECDFDNI